MYLSFKWANLNKVNYFLRMMGFTILASFMSMTFTWIFAGSPLSWFSFPFASNVEWSSATGVTGYHIQFLSFRIFTTPSQNGMFFGFLFLLGMNLVAVALGRWIKGSLEEKLFDFFIESGAISMVCCYIIWLSYYPLHLRQLVPSPQMDYEQYLFESNFYLVYTLLLYFFWIPALIATVIYGLKRRKE